MSLDYMHKNDQRFQQLQYWLDKEIKLPAREITPASSDASFRRYFRLSFNDETRIVMDAPPEKEQLEPFISVARQLEGIGLHVPHIESIDHDNGFLLMSDLGSTQYLHVLNEENVDKLYGDAMGALAVIQSSGPVMGEIPGYDYQLLMNEMMLFKDWYLGKHLDIHLTDKEQKLLMGQFEMLAQNALEQPQVAVHRDYHSRNLMVCERNPGILDFQDAVTGAVTYDLVSLLRDCYIEWPQQQIEQWVDSYHDIALDNGILETPEREQFHRWFDLMGGQRHLKAAGIFARLNHRDGKPGYLDDIPRTLGYVKQVCERYSELSGLQQIIELAER